MATQTIEPNTELKEASMTTLLAPDQSETSSVYAEPLSPVEAVQRLIQHLGYLEEQQEIRAQAEMATYVPAPTHRDGLLVSSSKPVASMATLTVASGSTASTIADTISLSGTP